MRSHTSSALCDQQTFVLNTVENSPVTFALLGYHPGL